MRVAYDDKGRELDDPLEVDPAETGLTILEVIDPEVLKLEVSEKL